MPPEKLPATLPAMPAEALERLSGPAAATARFAAWDSALLELRGAGEGRFSLELWRFWEGWRLPTQPEPQASEAAGAAAPGDASFRPPGQPRASVLHREETRASFAGGYTAREVPALRLAGFRRGGLNQVFAEEPGLRVGGLPTWWSEDGRYFLYFAEEYQHWKVNALRAGGGDGLRAVRPGGRRAGRGFAHSGPVSGQAGDCEAARAALASPEGWFEVAAGDWAPLRPQVAAARAWALDFQAASAESEEVVAFGEDSAKESHSAGPIAFTGLRHGSPATGRLLLFLPSLAQPAEGGDAPAQVLVEGAEPEEAEDGGAGASGDPDALLLEPSREAKL